MAGIRLPSVSVEHLHHPLFERAVRGYLSERIAMRCECLSDFRANADQYCFGARQSERANDAEQPPRNLLIYKRHASDIEQNTLIAS